MIHTRKANLRDIPGARTEQDYRDYCLSEIFVRAIHPAQGYPGTPLRVVSGKGAYYDHQ